MPHPRWVLGLWRQKRVSSDPGIFAGVDFDSGRPVASGCVCSSYESMGLERERTSELLGIQHEFKTADSNLREYNHSLL
jgi:hypothetical protein